MGKSVLASIISREADADYINNVAINISYELCVQHITIKDLSKRTGIAEATLRLRLNNPGTFKQAEIVMISNALKISPFKLVSAKLKYEEVQQ